MKSALHRSFNAILFSAALIAFINLEASADTGSGGVVFRAQRPCTNSIPALSAASGGVAWRSNPSACGGNAAIVTSGRFSSFFSWVARDALGRDRIPNQNCERNSCSVAKVQRTFYMKKDGIKVRVWCLGTSGKSALGKTFKRITGKSRNPADPVRDIYRFCINPKKNIN